MTKQRYRVINHDEYDYELDYIVDSQQGFKQVHIDDCCKLMNENEGLKQFQTNVFGLINEMIETANLHRTPIKSVPLGDDLGYWNGVYQKLKELRDILENEESRQ